MSTEARCDLCGSIDLALHCTSVTCNWWRCKACKAFGKPGVHMLPEPRGAK